jgi:Ca2+-binding EF-hand superfamily protein
MVKPKTSSVLITLAIATLVVIVTMAGITFAQKVSVPRALDKLALGEDEVKQLLLLMDTNENGKISKEEYMKFMEEEFKRLDKDKSGMLDPKELTESKVRVSHFAYVGK